MIVGKYGDYVRKFMWQLCRWGRVDNCMTFHKRAFNFFISLHVDLTILKIARHIQMIRVVIRWCVHNRLFNAKFKKNNTRCVGCSFKFILKVSQGNFKDFKRFRAFKELVEQKKTVVFNSFLCKLGIFWHLWAFKLAHSCQKSPIYTRTR
jgi:hypothetical protein